MLAASEAAGVAHVVAQSFGAFNGIREGGWVKTEEDPLYAAAETKAIEHLEDVVVKAGGAVLRYGSLYGPGATDDQVKLVRRRLFPLVGGGTGYFSWVHLDDAASATVLAVEQHAVGVFNIVDDEPAPVSQWLPYLAECAGAKPPRRLPAWLARLLAREMVVGMMTDGRGFSNAKAKRELGWELRYSSWRQGFTEEFAWPGPGSSRSCGRCCSRSLTGSWAAWPRPRTRCRRPGCAFRPARRGPPRPRHSCRQR